MCRKPFFVRAVRLLHVGVCPFVITWENSFALMGGSVSHRTSNWGSKHFLSRWHLYKGNQRLLTFYWTLNQSPKDAADQPDSQFLCNRCICDDITWFDTTYTLFKCRRISFFFLILQHPSCHQKCLIKYCLFKYHSHYYFFFNHKSSNSHDMLLDTWYVARPFVTCFVCINPMKCWNKLTM